MTARDGSFDSGFMANGDAYTHTFTSAGTFEYFCDFHPNMVATVTVGGGGSGGGSPTAQPTATPTTAPPPPPTAPGDVQVLDFEYGPQTVSVAAGASVRFVNVGVAPHTVTANDGSFDSGFMSTGDAFSHTFSTPGTYGFFCVIHPNMTGTVLVAGAGGAVPESQPQPTPTQAPPPPPVAPGDVQILDFDYSPRSLSISVGQSVRFVNVGVAPHTVTAKDGKYDSGFMTTGTAYNHTFSAAGVYEYFCVIHPQMVGSVRVVGSSGDPSQPDAAVAAEETPTTAATVTSAPGGGSPVSMIDFSYGPPSVTIKTGGSVTWTNNGVAPHTVTAKDGKYDSGLVKKGETFTRKYDAAGTYEYFCTLHPQMVGAVIVSDTAGAAPDAARTKVETVPTAAPQGSDGGDSKARNMWMLVWGVVVLTGVVALPTVMIASRGRPS